MYDADNKLFPSFVYSHQQWIINDEIRWQEFGVSAESVT